MAIGNNMIVFEQDFDTNWEDLRIICKDIYAGNKEKKDWVPALLYAYTTKIKEYVSLMNKNGNDNQLYEAQLERWLWGTEISDSISDQATIWATHPISLLNELYYDLAREEIENVCSDMEKEIGLSIVASKVRNREKLSLSFWGNEYKYKREKECLKKFEYYGSLTRIQGIRLIEKIEDLQKKINKKYIEIAYFGELEDLNDVNLYFEKDAQPVFYKYEYKEESVFYNAERDTIINLRDTFSLMKFVHSYDLVLFLDESYFYKRYQSHKDEREEKAESYINWNYQNLTEDKGQLAQMNIYYNIFEMANKFFKGRNTHMSAEYEYDEQLIKKMEAVVINSKESCADIYFYMKNGILADKNIELLNVCKDEFYDGKNLIVYKIPGSSNQKASVVVLEKELKIDFWKIIKSISNDYYDRFWKHLAIKELKNSYIILKDFWLEKEENSKLIVNYDINIQGEVDSEENERQMIQFAEAVFAMIQNDKIMNCVKEYLRVLISDSALSRANSVRDVMMSYFILKKNNIEFRKVDKADWNREQFCGTELGCYKNRKNVYTIIEKLEQSIIRDTEQMENVICFTFKSKYAEDIEEIEFKKYLSDIHKICEEIGDIESRLYLYTDIF